MDIVDVYQYVHDLNIAAIIFHVALHMVRPHLSDTHLTPS